MISLFDYVAVLATDLLKLYIISLIEIAIVVLIIVWSYDKGG